MINGRFVKLNEEPIALNFIYVDENDDSVDESKIVFEFEGVEFDLEEFVKVRNNPWLTTEEYPDYIHAIHMSSYGRPLYLELVDEEAVNLYNIEYEDTNIGNIAIYELTWKSENDTSWNLLATYRNSKDAVNKAIELSNDNKYNEIIITNNRTGEIGINFKDGKLVMVGKIDF